MFLLQCPTLRWIFVLYISPRAWILELSKDLFHTSTQLGPADHLIVQSVRVNHPTGRVDRPDHVLILTPSTSTTRMNLDRRRVTLTNFHQNQQFGLINNYLIKCCIF